MKISHVKAIGAAVLALACFVWAAVAAARTFYFNQRVAAFVHKSGHVAAVEALRAGRNNTYQEMPLILFLCCVGVVLGIVAIRFFNRAKSEFE